MSYDGEQRMENFRKAGTAYTLPSNRGFIYFAGRTKSNSWVGFPNCTSTESLVVYTGTSDIILSIGVTLYEDRKLNNLYQHQYFVYEGVRYTIEAGKIKVIEICDFYMM